MRVVSWGWGNAFHGIPSGIPAMVWRACFGFIGLSARVPRGTDGNGHVSLFVSAYASPMLSGSLYEGGPNFNSLVINNHNPCLKDFSRLPKMCTHYLVESAFFHSSAHSTAQGDSLVRVFHRVAGRRPVALPYTARK